MIPIVEGAFVDLAANRPGQRLIVRADELYAQWRAKPLIRRYKSGRRNERIWRKGAAGEQLVAKQLDKLGNQYHVLHSIPVGARGNDLDHLVIGTTGVFTVNSKSHLGLKVWVGGDTVMVHGHPQPYVRNSRSEANRVSAILTNLAGYEVPVIGMVLVVGKSFTEREQPRDSAVRVTTPREAVQWIKRRRRLLTEDEVAALFEIARRSTTWTVGARRV